MNLPTDIENLIYSFNDFKIIKNKVINQLNEWFKRKDEQCKFNLEKWGNLDAWLPNFSEYYFAYLNFDNLSRCLNVSDWEDDISDWEDDISSESESLIFEMN